MSNPPYDRNPTLRFHHLTLPLVLRPLYIPCSHIRPHEMCHGSPWYGDIARTNPLVKESFHRPSSPASGVFGRKAFYIYLGLIWHRPVPLKHPATISARCRVPLVLPSFFLVFGTVVAAASISRPSLQPLSTLGTPPPLLPFLG